MKINNELFDECIDMENGIHRVCLRGNLVEDLCPIEIIRAAKEIDGDVDYEPSCFAIDINENGAMIVYMDMQNGYSEICPCDNWQEAEMFFQENWHGDEMY